MMHHNEKDLKSIGKAVKHSVSLSGKLVIIGFICVLLLLLSMMIRSLITEREQRRQLVIDELCEKWGENQRITGPVIIVPYQQKRQINNNGHTATVSNYLYLLPELLEVNGEILPEERYRGIFKVILYNAKLNVSGLFKVPDYQSLNISKDDVVWSKAMFCLGISDLKGIKEQILVKLNDKEIAISPTDVPIHNEKEAPARPCGSPMMVPQDWETIPFDFSLNLNGSKQISFVPIGRTTNVSLSSTWKDPSFDGVFLPYERKVSDQGFSVVWKILDLNRNLPQTWLGRTYDLKDLAFGVKLFPGVDIYQKSMRTVKYAVLFIVFTFTAIFISEVITRIKVHPVQYLLIGFAVTIFYVLLLSFSEHISFNLAYIVAAVAVVGLIASYCKAIYRKLRLVVTMAGILSALYAYLYIVLQSENYALLMGSIGIFILLALVMFITRKINWYSVNLDENSQVQPTV